MGHLVCQQIQIIQLATEEEIECYFLWEVTFLLALHFP